MQDTAFKFLIRYLRLTTAVNCNAQLNHFCRIHPTKLLRLSPSLRGDILENRRLGDFVEIEIEIDLLSFGLTLFVCPSVVALSLEFSSLVFMAVGSISLGNISHLDVLWRLFSFCPCFVSNIGSGVLT